MKQQVFLGGTCGENNWRKAFAEALLGMGVSNEAIFDPVVPDWNEEAQRLEDAAKAESQYMLFFLGNPGTPGNEVSAYSLVEATMGLYDSSERTVVVLDTEGMSGHVAKAMTKAIKDMRARFPEAPIFDNATSAVEWLAERLG